MVYVEYRSTGNFTTIAHIIYDTCTVHPLPVLLPSPPVLVVSTADGQVPTCDEFDLAALPGLRRKTRKAGSCTLGNGGDDELTDMDDSGESLRQWAAEGWSRA